MVYKTNISNYDPATGRTETLLVDDHDRGCKDYYTAGDSTPAAPTLTTLTPATGTTAGTVVTLTGTGFRDGAVVRQSNTNIATTFNSATSLTATLGAGVAAGAKSITVRNPDGDLSNAQTFTVT